MASRQSVDSMTSLTTMARDDLILKLTPLGPTSWVSFRSTWQLLVISHAAPNASYRLVGAAAFCETNEYTYTRGGTH